MTNFIVGSQVIFISDFPNGNVMKGMKGKIVHLCVSEPSIGVEWDHNVYGHTCQHNCINGLGYYVYPKELRLCINNLIVDEDGGYIIKEVTVNA